MSIRPLAPGLVVVLILFLPGSPVAGQGDSGLSPLLEAVLHGGLEKAEALIDAGADPSASGDALSMKPLVHAAWNGDAAMVKMLLAKGASVDGVGAGWQTPLMLASGTGSLGVVKILLKAGAGMKKSDRDGATAVCHAAAGRSPAVLAHYSKIGKLKNLTDERVDHCALEYAVVAGRARNVKLLIKKGADPTEKDMYGRSLLDRATDPEVKKILKKAAKKKKKKKKKGKKMPEPYHMLGVLGATSAGGGASKAWDHLLGVQAVVIEHGSGLSGCLYKMKKKPKAPWANLALGFNANGKLLSVDVTAGEGLAPDFESCAADVLAAIGFAAPPSGAIVIPASVDL
ncbi:MAG: ankyrin repeat domain-containing protein [Deltaproteobacteria bacterium]|nr:ankyrin repeat domain-containing protein [Deltaproteobacteria bacterium]